MITSVYYRPFVLSATTSPIVWEVNSDKTAEPNFKYVWDIWINRAFYIRIKSRPKPSSGHGIIDVSQFCESQIDLNSNWLTVPAGEPFGKGNSISGDVFIKLGEEYSSSEGTVPDIYNGTDNLAPANPNYLLYAYNDGTINTSDTKQVMFFGMRLDNVEAYQVELNPVSSIGQYCPQGTTSLFMTTHPRDEAIKLQEDESYTFVFENDRFLNPAGDDNFVAGVLVEPYGATGSLSSFYLTNTVDNGGGPRVACDQFYTPPDNSFDFMQFIFSPCLVTQDAPTAYGAYISLRDFNGCIVGNQISEKLHIEFTEPDCSGFEKWRIGWVNKLGGLDFFSFEKRDTLKSTTKSTEYYKLPSYWNEETYGITSLDPMKSGTFSTRTETDVTYTASTDWLTEAQSEFLRGLFESPLAFTYFPIEGACCCGDPRHFTVPIRLKNTSYEEQNYKRQKLFQVTVEFTMNKLNLGARI